ncbi:MAG: gliding motility-associated C-terminal domain-containing protein [Flavobacteriales bacterium]|nr:gliding motility-associated C-terminal domain-containing protein [Flavobacteriales bacterium]
MRKIYLFAFFILFFVGTASKVAAQCGTTPITGDLIISANTSLSGVYNITGLFRVEPGVVVTVTPYSSGGCGELTINAADIEVIGDIIGDAAGYLGGSGGAGASAGSNVGALTGCLDKDNCLVISVNGGAAGSAGSGPGSGISGVAGTLGMGPKQTCQNFGDTYGFVGGAGGAGGAGGGSYGGVAGLGGVGGNGAAYNSGNFSGMSLSSCSSASAGTGGAGGTLGTAYGTTAGTDIALGSGGAGAGGGGKSASNGAVGLAGGSGGGLVALYASGHLTVAGNISVNGQVGGAGGAGGAGGTTTDCCSDACNECGERTFSSGAGGGGGSGGGSGGGILLKAQGVSTITGTLRAIGGNGGTGGTGGAGHNGCTYSNFFCGSNSGNSNAGAAGALGGGASGGRIKIFQNPCQSNVISASILYNGGNGFGGAATTGTYYLGDIAGIVAPTATSSADSVSCFGLSDGSASVVVSGGLAPFTYSWSPIGGSAATASNLPAGSYDVTVVDANMCEVVETVVVPQPDTLTAQVFGIIDADCYSFSTGEASAMGLGGTSPYSYLWNDPQTQITSTATNLPNGSWIVEITDYNGCVATDTAVIGQPQPFSASVAVGQQVTCFGQANGQATVTANGIGLTYAWNDPATQTTATASNLAAGSYNVTVFSSQTCDTTLTVVITEPALLTVLAVQNQQVSCNGGSNGIALASGVGGTAPFTYQWDDSNLQTTASATGLTAGTYNVIVTDANLCTANGTVTIAQAPAMSVAVNIDSASCNGSSDASIMAIVSGGTPGYTYSWNPNAVSGNPLTGIAAGSYSLTVTDANNCTAELQNILVQQPLPIVLSLVQQQNVSCNGASDGQALISALGGTPSYTYSWNDPTNQSTALAGGLPPGTYAVVVTDANGCTAQWQNVNITEPAALLVSVTSVTPITCDYSEDGVAETQVTGGTLPYGYAWSDPSGQTGSTAIDLGAGTFTVTVTDAHGCTAQAQAIIDPPVTALTADFSLSPETGLQPLDITVTNLSQGGTAYEWIFGDGNIFTTFNTDPFQYLYADSGMFTLTLVAYNDVTGCSDTMRLENGIYVEPTSFIRVPNVITPNGDGINDMFPIDPIQNNFFPFDIRNIYDFKGEIYNRWGEKVYDWTQPLAGWDGRTTSGLNLVNGTYFFVITAKGVDGDSVTKYEFKGDVMLIK